MMQHFTDSSFFLRVLDHTKRRGLHDVTVSLIERPPYRLKRTVELQIFRKGLGIKISTINFVTELIIFFSLGGV